MHSVYSGDSSQVFVGLSAPASLCSCVQPFFLRICIIFHHIPFPLSMFRMFSFALYVWVAVQAFLPISSVVLSSGIFPFLPYYFPPQYISVYSRYRLPRFLCVALHSLACHTFLGFFPFPFSPFSVHSSQICVGFLPCCCLHVLHFSFFMRIEYPGHLCWYSFYCPISTSIPLFSFFLLNVLFCW
jgi:hypothetical protein